uniref:Uncharacterized protein n=1 Tax=Glossina brevipalpis TaxID=37001 RepID=A0A1A9WKR6_9MUSC
MADEAEAPPAEEGEAPEGEAPPEGEQAPPPEGDEGAKPAVDMDDGEDYSPLGSEDDLEKERNYKDYKRLVKEINCENETIERVKQQIQDIICKPCNTSCEQKDLKCLQECLDQESAKLLCLINKAMHLQNFGSKRRYKEIPLVTTFDEDQMTPISYFCETMQVQTSKKTPVKREPGTCCPSKSHSKAKRSTSSSECETSQSREVCSESYSSSGESDEECDDKQVVKEIFEALKTCKNKKPCPHNHKKTSQDDSSVDNLKEKLCCLQKTLDNLKGEICRRKVEKDLNQPCPHHRKSHDISKPCPPKSHSKNYNDHEVDPPPIDTAILCKSTKSNKEDQLQKLKGNYIYLLTEFSKKDEQLREMSEKQSRLFDNRLKNVCGGGAGRVPPGSKSTRGNADESELTLLRNRVGEFEDEQKEFKCLLKEQNSQLDDYIKKYLAAQQKVEEQKATIEKLNMNNKTVEKQINAEVKQIRAKFQEKVNELLKYPKLLENEQLKLADTCKEKEELQDKLVIVCKELKSLKKQQNESGGQDDSQSRLRECQQELTKVNKNLEEVQRQRDLFCEQLRNAEEDLNTLRCESAKIIARTKERSEVMKEQMQNRMDRLEKDVAQCRAAACLSVNDREAVIKEMRGQINTLSYSFDAAQKQIKTLRNHIAYMSNENCFPIKC